MSSDAKGFLIFFFLVCAILSCVVTGCCVDGLIDANLTKEMAKLGYHQEIISLPGHSQPSTVWVPEKTGDK